MFRATLAAALVLALASPARAANEIGVNAHVPATDVVQLAADLGAHWIRVDNNWFQNGNPCSASIEPFPPLDQSVTDAVAAGLKVYMTLAYTPACASTGNGDGQSNLNDVPDPTLYASYVRQSVAHYRAMGVTHFGLWNEANLDHFFEGTASQYVSSVVLPGLTAVAQGCQDAGFGDCKSLGPDLAHVGDYDQFLETVLSTMNGAGASFDILAHHIYQGHDTQPFQGDSFYNALQERRFAFTRRSFVNVLSDVGMASGGVPNTEVWITETGYHAQPATDAGEMAKQSDYYMKTVDEQLARPWYTNSFFYEILDSGDDLDGFGMTRRTDAGFQLKDSYLALQQRLATDPGFQPQGGDGDADADAGPGDGDGDGGMGEGPGDADAGAGNDNGSGDAGMGDSPSESGGCSVGGDTGLAPLLLLLGLWGFRRRRPESPRAH